MNPDPTRVRAALSRRRFLQLGLVTGVGLAARCEWPVAGSGYDLPEYPFTLGVASGDPLPDRVVLWTRLAPFPLAGGGMPATPVVVGWEVAHDEQFMSLAAVGGTRAVPQFGHSVHADVGNLEPGRWYFYRFHVGPWTSPVGRTRTCTIWSSSSSLRTNSV